MSRVKKVSVTTSVSGNLAVMINGRFHYPKKQSAERLISLLGKETPKSVRIDPQGPIVRYEYSCISPPHQPGRSGDNPQPLTSKLCPH